MVSRRISTASAKQELRKLLPSDELDKPVRELSGGMRRRVCIVRACIIPSDIIIMDEPFAGLDRVNRQKAIQYILDAKGTTPLVITDHSAEGLDFCRKVLAWNDELDNEHLEQKVEELIPGPKPTYRCCIYKEREVTRQRMRLAQAKNATAGSNSHNIVQVMKPACDECPLSSYAVT